MGKKKALDDARFSRIKSDPIFSGLKSTDRKVVLDKRFAAALTDEKFSTRSKVDMRGRKQKKAVGNDMLDLYELEEDEKPTTTKKKVKETEVDDFFNEDGDDEEEEEEEEEEEGEEESDDEEEPEIKGGFKKLDLARGEGNLDSSSDDDSSEEEGDEEEEEDEEGWEKSKESMQLEADLGHLDKDVEQIEWTSKRLAVCNLEWDHINCEDILMLVKSFVPAEGGVKSVGIYVSDFGKEKIDYEEVNGPSLKLPKPIEEYEEGEMDPETKTAVRKYLLDRLKYYYAVIEFDSDDSALAVYNECDGFQFEETGLKMDMRFVPDEMEFEKDRIKEFINADDVNTKKYKPKKKPKNSITSTNTKISWDEDDPSRSKKFLDAFDGNEKSGQDLIVGSDEEEESDSEDKNEKRKMLLSLLNVDEKEKKIDIEWDDGDNKGKQIGSDSDSSDGEYVKCEEDDDNIGISNKTSKNSDDDDDQEEEEDSSKPEEKLNGYQKYLKKKKTKLAEKKLGKRRSQPNQTIKSAEIVENVQKDSRFTALFTDSAFAIEPSSKKFKGSQLAARQVEHKVAAVAAEASSKKEKSNDDLVAQLKKKSEKWKKK